MAVEVPTPRTPGYGGALPGAPTHVTLRFLGEVDPAQLPAITDALRAATAGRPAFRFALGGVGAFPSVAHPRVVWVGFSEGADLVCDLAARVTTALEPLGFPKERGEFVPHVTLFRVRGPRDQARAREVLATPPTGRLGEGEVTELLLKESELTARGAVHTTRARFPLAHGAASA